MAWLLGILVPLNDDEQERSAGDRQGGKESGGRIKKEVWGDTHKKFAKSDQKGDIKKQAKMRIKKK